MGPGGKKAVKNGGKNERKNVSDKTSGKLLNSVIRRN